MITAKDIMTKNPIVVRPETEIPEAAKLLLEKNINGIPVVNDQNELVGIICQSDLVAMQRKIPVPSLFTLFDSLLPLGSTSKMDREIKKIAAARVEDAMTPSPVHVGEDTGLEDLAEIMVNKKFHTLPVVENGRLVGVVGKADVLKTLMKEK
ncbi:CBS domain-containing protein [Desulfonatronovibrio hydrogenovorans]|uniref:CBS domain-containing protein n=1 Tax=Desulfonatronovibrio hydrogenovorans TaxID=53245 RepID=UPI00048EA42C|nr:CBS domain-containing protein [Desulfonatronovibrio hydrogenovorans]